MNANHQHEEKGSPGEKKPLRWLPLVLGGIMLALLLVSFRSSGDKSVSLPAPTQTALAAKSSLHIFDKSSAGQELLFSKTSTGDLWFRDANDRERCLASNVIRATFSPDGKKIAFDTRDNEIFVETIEGKPLARLARASDHAWSSNSAAIIFSATASADYPQLEQTVIYDLLSDRLRAELPPK